MADEKKKKIDGPGETHSTAGEIGRITQPKAGRITKPKTGRIARPKTGRITSAKTGRIARPVTGTIKPKKEESTEANAEPVPTLQLKQKTSDHERAPRRLGSRDPRGVGRSKFVRPS